ncbi:hypothetical protein HHSLTHF2_33450 [Vreelandella venusta]|jgi:hypothetical protein|uniref:Uncharacterized protein n=1 Tax=Halomonas hydrothermalis TaxID=115561 RepID=A0A6F8U965_9GAMM|nr:hypothetical protein HHSLTHF2_33450 [Halomonas hydrothermalis]
MQTSAMSQLVTVRLDAVQRETEGNLTMLALKLHDTAMRLFYPVTHRARERHCARRYLCCEGTHADVTATVG